jgi:hypothetical protein
MTEDTECLLTINGFTIDIFKTESGSLGMTVTEAGKMDDFNASSIDIFIENSGGKLLITSG